MIYTSKVDKPLYEAKGECPKIEELYDRSVYDSLLKEIEESKCPSKTKKFLEYASSRHVKFNYSKIAEYYCHADKEVQKLMERLLLVAVDFEDLKTWGFVKLKDKEETREVREFKFGDEDEE